MNIIEFFDSVDLLYIHCTSKEQVEKILAAFIDNGGERIGGREITIKDVEECEIQKDMYICSYTAYLEDTTLDEIEEEGGSVIEFSDIEFTKSITLELSVKEQYAFMELIAEEEGLTPERILSQFISDLTGSNTYPSGSDERRLAAEWFSRNKYNF